MEYQEVVVASFEWGTMIYSFVFLLLIAMIIFLVYSIVRRGKAKEQQLNQLNRKVDQLLEQQQKQNHSNKN